MGSGASVVTKTDVEVLNDKRDELSGRLSKDSLISKRPKSDFKKSTDNYFLETKYKQLLEENDKLKKELEIVQKENNELIDEITSLESQFQIFYQNNENQDNVKQDFQKIMENKDKKIKELEEKLISEEKLKIVFKSKYVEKVNKLKSKIDSLKQENALKTVELRDKINKLQTENNLLNDKMNLFSENEEKNDNTKLIIELSSHITEKDVMIMQLNSEIDEKDTKIGELENHLKSLKKKLKINDNGVKRSNSILISNNSRYNSAPLKSPIDNKLNVKEFMPVDEQQSYGKIYNLKANNHAINTSNLENKKSIFNNDFLNSSASSLLSN